MKIPLEKRLLMQCWHLHQKTVLSLPLREVDRLNCRGLNMWNWLNCYLSGRHDFGVSCHSGSIFLRCIHCGKRSNGWAVHGEQALAAIPPRMIERQPVATLRRALPYTPQGIEVRQKSA
jgi:hypothetical protein